MILLIAVLVLLTIACGVLIWKYIDISRRVDVLTDEVASAGTSIADVVGGIGEVEGDIITIQDDIAELCSRMTEHEADKEQLERERKELKDERRIVDGMANIFAYDLATAMGKKKGGAE